MFIFWLGYIADSFDVHYTLFSAEIIKVAKEKKHPKLNQKLRQMIYLNTSGQTLDEHFINLVIRSYVVNNLTII